jgi:hypothetical protein
MLCPKCGYQNPPNRQDCLRCGVIFAKIRVHANSPVQSQAQEVAADLPDRDSSLRNLLLSCPDEVNLLLFTGRALVLLGMIVWGSKLIFVSIASNASGESWPHLVNLPFHEAGHVIFRPFGQFIASLGGTLGQLLVPLVCMATLLLKTRDPFGTAVCFWWLGENFLDIAPYIDDARAGQLPLTGGNLGHSSPYGFHDWEFLLTETGLLSYDHMLARVSHGVGSLAITLSIAWAGYLLYRQFPRRQEGRNQKTGR